MSSWLGWLLRMAAASGVPGLGFAAAGWSPATALALYWCDNVVGTLAMARRIAVHRRLTGAPEHAEAHLTSKTDRFGKPLPSQTFLSDFLGISLVFTVGHGIFMWSVLLLLLEGVDFGDVGRGLLGIVACHGLALALDARTIGAWPFAALKQRSEHIMTRITLIHLALLGGGLLLAFRRTPGQFFVAFVWLKALADVLTLLPRSSERAGVTAGLDRVTGA
jgi:Family of unknown function (DUF6498)